MLNKEVLKCLISGKPLQVSYVDVVNGTFIRYIHNSHRRCENTESSGLFKIHRYFNLSFLIILSFTAQNLNVAWSPCGTYLAYGDKEDSLSILDSRNLKTIKVESLKDEVNEFAFDPSGKYLFVAMGSGQVNIFS